MSQEIGIIIVAVNRSRYVAVTFDMLGLKLGFIDLRFHSETREDIIPS